MSNVKPISYKGKELYVPRWFVEKNLDGFSVNDFYGAVKNVTKTTEKAIRVGFDYTWYACYGNCWNHVEYPRKGHATMWIPKSVLLDHDGFAQSELDYIVRQAEYEAKREAAQKAAFEKGAKYNEYLRELAKSNGVKLGNAKCTATIMDILDRKGIKYIAKKDFAA